MKIDDYTFGRIIIDGKAYDNDVIIYPDRVKENWRRKKGHCLKISDLEGVFKRRPRMLIVGAGHVGRMEVPQKTIDALAKEGIETRVEKTARAVELFNELSPKGDVAAALHLTC